MERGLCSSYDGMTRAGKRVDRLGEVFGLYEDVIRVECGYGKDADAVFGQYAGNG